MASNVQCLSKQHYRLSSFCRSWHQLPLYQSHFRMIWIAFCVYLISEWIDPRDPPVNYLDQLNEGIDVSIPSESYQTFMVLGAIATFCVSRIREEVLFEPHIHTHTHTNVCTPIFIGFNEVMLSQYKFLILNAYPP
eukprot:90450_1